MPNKRTPLYSTCKPQQQNNATPKYINTYRVLTTNPTTNYNKSKKVSRPISARIMLRILTFGFIFIVALGLSNHVDPVDNLVTYDISLMDANPSKDTHVISSRIKFAFDKFSNQDIRPQAFKYFTSIHEHAALILVQIPNLHQIRREGRLQAIELIELISDKHLTSKEVYIGVIGKKNLMLVKTPKTLKNNRKVSLHWLHDFYTKYSEDQK